MSFWGALAATAVAVGTGIYVSYDGYGTVLRQIAWVVLPWLAVWAAFREDYRVATAIFGLIAVLALWQGIGWQVSVGSAAVAAATLVRALVPRSAI